MRMFFITIILLMTINALSAQNLYENPIRAYIDGTEVLSYKTEEYEISLAPRLSDKEYGFGKELKLVLVLKNDDENPVDFNPANIKAYTEKKGKRKELDVYTANEYLKKLKKNILWFGPDNVEKVNATTTIKDGQGQKTGKVESTVSVYTGGQDAAYSDAEEYVRKDAEEYVRKEYLKRNTVFPVQELNGIIAVENRKTHHRRVGIVSVLLVHQEWKVCLRQASYHR